MTLRSTQGTFPAALSQHGDHWSFNPGFFCSPHNSGGSLDLQMQGVSDHTLYDGLIERTFCSSTFGHNYQNNQPQHDPSFSYAFESALPATNRTSSIQKRAPLKPDARRPLTGTYPHQLNNRVNDSGHSFKVGKHAANTNSSFLKKKARDRKAQLLKAFAPLEKAKKVLNHDSISSELFRQESESLFLKLETLIDEAISSADISDSFSTSESSNLDIDSAYGSFSNTSSSSSSSSEFGSYACEEQTVHVEEEHDEPTLSEGFEHDIDMGEETPRPEQPSATVYHCTYEINGKRCSYFTSKESDWIRHEESEKHWPQKRYMCLDCAEPKYNESLNPCCIFCSSEYSTREEILKHTLDCIEAKNKGEIFAGARRGHFRRHLIKVHHRSGIDEETAQWTFNLRTKWPRYCGFCTYRFKDWKDRSDHVANHFREGADISAWDPFFHNPRRERGDEPNVLERKDRDDDEDDDDDDWHQPGKGEYAMRDAAPNGYTTSSSSSGSSSSYMPENGFWANNDAGWGQYKSKSEEARSVSSAGGRDSRRYNRQDMKRSTSGNDPYGNERTSSPISERFQALSYVWGDTIPKSFQNKPVDIKESPDIYPHITTDFINLTVGLDDPLKLNLTTSTPTPAQKTPDKRSLVLHGIAGTGKYLFGSLEQSCSNQDFKSTPTSLGWNLEAQLWELYDLILSKGQEPYLELRSSENVSEKTPLKVFLDPPSDPQEDIHRCRFPNECSKEFKRPADLQRHYIHVHMEAQFSWDCKPAVRTIGFYTQKDYFKDHPKEFHKQNVGIKQYSSPEYNKNSPRHFNDDRKFTPGLLEEELIEWLSETKNYQNWIDRKQPLHRLLGSVGAGESCSNSAIVDDFTTRSSTLNFGIQGQIWQAARATSAAPTFFHPLQSETGKFEDGGVSCNNPIPSWVPTLKQTYSQDVSPLMLSIGTGQCSSLQPIMTGNRYKRHIKCYDCKKSNAFDKPKTEGIQSQMLFMEYEKWWNLIPESRNPPEDPKHCLNRRDVSVLLDIGAETNMFSSAFTSRLKLLSPGFSGPSPGMCLCDSGWKSKHSGKRIAIAVIDTGLISHMDESSNPKPRHSIPLQRYLHSYNPDEHFAYLHSIISLTSRHNNISQTITPHFWHEWVGYLRLRSSGGIDPCKGWENAWCYSFQLPRGLYLELDLGERQERDEERKEGSEMGEGSEDEGSDGERNGRNKGNGEQRKCGGGDKGQDVDTDLGAASGDVCFFGDIDDVILIEVEECLQLAEGLR